MEKDLVSTPARKKYTEEFRKDDVTDQHSSAASQRPSSAFKPFCDVLNSKYGLHCTVGSHVHWGWGLRLDNLSSDQRALFRNHRVDTREMAGHGCGGKQGNHGWFFIRRLLHLPTACRRLRLMGPLVTNDSHSLPERRSLLHHFTATLISVME